MTDEQREANRKAAAKQRDKGRYGRMTPEEKERHHAANNRYRARNPDKVSAWSKKAVKKYRDTHPLTEEQREARRIACREWHAKNGGTPARKKRVRDYQKSWYQQNKERVLNRRREWSLANPDKARIYSHRRRALLAASGAPMPTAIVPVLWKRQRGVCVACNADLHGVKWEIDHIVPLASGGDNGNNNLQLLCRTCNRSKGARDPIQFMQEKGFLL